MIIDFHTHIFSPDIQNKRDRYIEEDPCFRLLYSNPKAKLVTADDIIASMDEQHIDISIILNIGWTKHELCVLSNDYILESAAQHPKRLIGFCAVQPLAGDCALREIERCAASGARGIGEIRPDIQGYSLSDSSLMKPVVDMLIEKRMIMLTHASEPVGHDYAGKGSITPDAIYPFIIEHPGLSIVCAHWGGGLPFYALMPEVFAAFTNTYFDTAASPFLYKPSIFKHMADIIGSDHILFGTDFPLMPQRRVINQINASGLSEKETGEICELNAKKLLGL